MLVRGARGGVGRGLGRPVDKRRLSGDEMK